MFEFPPEVCGFKRTFKSCRAPRAQLRTRYREPRESVNHLDPHFRDKASEFQRKSWICPRERREKIIRWGQQQGRGESSEEIHLFFPSEMWRVGLRWVCQKLYSPGAGGNSWTDTRCVLRGSQMLLRWQQHRGRKWGSSLGLAVFPARLCPWPLRVRRLLTAQAHCICALHFRWTTAQTVPPGVWNVDHASRGNFLVS